jgi:hypothetical protein
LEQKDKEEVNKAKRRETKIKLSKKTKKGQPVMANHINHLLAKLQK